MGDSLLFTDLVIQAKQWFILHNVEVPRTCSDWRNSRVSNLDIPPGLTYGTLLRKSINVSDFIAAILDIKSAASPRNPINSDNSEDIIGLKIVSTEYVNKHAKCSIICLQCGRSDILDYGTLTRMRKSGSKFC